MVKDYFQDIVPPHEEDDAEDVGLPPRRDPREAAMHDQNPMPQTGGGGDRSIRNININRRGYGAPPPPRHHSGGGSSKSWIWILAAVCVVGLGTLGVMFAFKETSITIIPVSQPVLFDETSQFTAYPNAASTSGTILYSVKTADFEETEQVAASGTEHKEQKASGSITVYNDYSAEPVKLIKNTRFATASGLVYRTPSDVSVPGRQGSTPGKTTITVAADAAGEKYNIGAGGKLTLPGLQSNAAMYKGVYAEATSAMTGGFSGDAPAVDAATLSKAKANMQSRLDQKISEFLGTLNTESDFALKPQVTYADAPGAAATGGTATVKMTAHVSVPTVSRSALSAAIAEFVTAGGSDLRYTLETGDGFAANVADESEVGTDPITFTLTGSGVLVADVDTNALKTALAGRDQNAFQTIVANFPGVESAKARIEPFWNTSFPTNTDEIEILVERPQNVQ